MPRISIITAFFNEAENLPVLRRRLEAVLVGLGVDYQIVLVDDHSGDDSPAYARRWADEDSSVCYLRLARNSGPHAAFSAGLAQARGDCAVLLSADLQDPPETIPQLLAQWKAGHDVVWACREERQGESRATKLFAGVYYRLMRRLALPEMHATGADFLLLDRKVIAAYNAVPEKNTSFLAMILWLGFRQTSIRYVKQARQAGRSKWSFSKKLKLFIDSLVSFSYVPIRLMSLAGLGLSLCGLLYAAVVVANFLAGHPVEGWSSLMLVTLVVGGFQLLMMGVLGEYLWRAYDECRGRPRYIVEEIRSAELPAVRDRAA
jgi:dolichol-phosphate mannosyltransferase